MNLRDVLYYCIEMQRTAVCRDTPAGQDNLRNGIFYRAAKYFRLRTLLFSPAQRKSPRLKSSGTIAWSVSTRKVPEIINSQLVGTFPAVVKDEEGKTCAIFIRASLKDLDAASQNSIKCMLRPQFVKTPHGPIVVACCMASPENGEYEPFISETALFPRLPSLPSHKEILDLLLSLDYAYFVACDEAGKCLLNAKAQIKDEWREELASRTIEFGTGKQISDEKTAIMALYWYQERYNPTDRLFEISH